MRWMATQPGYDACGRHPDRLAPRPLERAGRSGDRVRRARLMPGRRAEVQGRARARAWGRAACRGAGAGRASERGDRPRAGYRGGPNLRCGRAPTGARRIGPSERAKPEPHPGSRCSDSDLTRFWVVQGSCPSGGKLPPSTGGKVPRLRVAVAPPNAALPPASTPVAPRSGTGVLASAPTGACRAAARRGRRPGPGGSQRTEPFRMSTPNIRSTGENEKPLLTRHWAR
jgi:hypothetical protein